MDLIRFSQVETDRLSVYLPGDPVRYLLIPAAGPVDEPHKVLAADINTLTRRHFRHPLCTFIVDAAGFYPKHHILGAEEETEILRTAHGLQSLLEYPDPSGSYTKRYAGTGIVPCYILSHSSHLQTGRLPPVNCPPLLLL